MTHTVTIDGGPLSPSDVIHVAHGDAELVLDGSVAARMAPSQRLVERLVAEARDGIIASLRLNG